MTTHQPSSQDISRKLSVLIFGANFFGALIIFLYFSMIDPLPVGGVAVRALETEDIVIFGTVGLVIFAGAFAIISRLGRPIQNWLQLIEAGTPASQLPPNVARLVLIWPLLIAALVAVTGLLVAVFFSILHENPVNFVGIAISGAVTTAIIYFGTDLIWRQLVPTFFPDGHLSDVPVFRLWVQRRLLLAFSLIGGLTPILLVVLSYVRTRTLLNAENPEAVLENLILVQLFILVVGLVAGVVTAVLVARTIVEPLQVLQNAMGLVEKNKLNTRIVVTTNDELGYLSERFNSMTEGLRQREKLRKLFGLYVSSEVAQAAVQTGAGLGGELVNCSVMFSDIRDFTTLTEQMQPTRLVELINRYMTAMVSVIIDHGGLITRFGGDSILAVFGTPLNPMRDHADRAVKTAMKMREALASFNQGGADKGLPPLETGIGVASGPVIAGNVGGKERVEYTVMGDAVNLAARLEDKTKDTGFPILISEETHQALSEVSIVGATLLTNIQIKGKQNQVTIYGFSN